MRSALLNPLYQAATVLALMVGALLWRRRKGTPRAGGLDWEKRREECC